MALPSMLSQATLASLTHKNTIYPLVGRRKPITTIEYWDRTNTENTGLGAITFISGCSIF